MIGVKTSKAPTRVRFQPGFAIMAGALVLSLVFGTAIRFFFSNRRLTQLVHQALQPFHDQYIFEIEKLDLSLSNGVLPWIALKVGQATASGVHCGVQDEVKIEGLVIPLRFLSLLQGKVVIEKVELDHISWQQRFGPKCKGPSAAEAILNETLSDKSVANKEVIESESREVFSFWKPLVSQSGFPDVLKIKNASFLPLEGGKKIYFKNLLVKDLRGDTPKHLFSKVKIEGSGLASLPEFNVEVKLTSQLAKANILAHWKEGEVKFLADVKPKAKNDVELILTFDILHVPLFVITDLLQNSGMISTLPPPKQLWISCHGELMGPHTEITRLPWFLKDCIVEGDLGEIRVAQAVYSAQDEIKPFIVYVKNVNLQKVLNYLLVNYSSNQYSSLGLVDGELTFRSPQNIEFNGSISGFEFLFSNKGTRRAQLFNKIIGKIDFSNERFSGIIDEIIIDQGTYKGSVSFNLDRDLSQGLVQARLDTISFSPQIQKLMIGGTLDPFAFYGQIYFENNEIKRWRGDLGLSSLASEQFRLQDLKISFNYMNKILDFKGATENFYLHKGSFIFEQMRPIFLDFNFSSDWVKIKRLSARFRFADDIFQWQRLNGYVEEGKITLSSEGGWDHQGDLAGWISTDFPTLKLLKWNLAGRRDTPRLIPQSKLLKEKELQLKTILHKPEKGQ